MGDQQRTVHCRDAFAWLQESAPLTGCSIVTSLPDIKELPGLSLSAWLDWFQRAASLCMSAVPDSGVAIFFQTDVRHQGLWIDKAAVVSRAALDTGMNTLFHKVVCRKPAGSVTLGRASYAHMLAFSRALRPTLSLGRTTADVLSDGGFKPANKSMGVKACLDACQFIQRETSCRTIVDPFCGLGTVLAVANHLGLAAVGVDISQRMCRRACSLELDPAHLTA